MIDLPHHWLSSLRAALTEKWPSLLSAKCGEQFGFIIKRGLIPEAALQPYVDLWWQQPPVLAANLRPDDPTTFVEPGRHWWPDPPPPPLLLLLLLLLATTAALSTHSGG